MAWLIVDPNDQVFKIAANDTDKAALNYVTGANGMSEISITDDEFAKIKKELVTVSVSNGVATLTDIVWATPNTDKAAIKSYHVELKRTLKEFLDANETNSLKTACQNYYDYLDGIDYDNVSYSLDKSWENYCDENSIAYLHPLQIP